MQRRGDLGTGTRKMRPAKNKETEEASEGGETRGEERRTGKSRGQKKKRPKDESEKAMKWQKWAKVVATPLLLNVLNVSVRLSFGDVTSSGNCRHQEVGL